MVEDHTSSRKIIRDCSDVPFPKENLEPKLDVDDLDSPLSEGPLPSSHARKVSSSSI